MSQGRCARAERGGRRRRWHLVGGDGVLEAFVLLPDLKRKNGSDSVKVVSSDGGLWLWGMEGLRITLWC
jgi:hypothetical protein